MRRRGLKRSWLVPLTVVVGSIAAVAPSGAASGSGGPAATAARTQSFNINSTLHLVGRAGHVFNEQGTFRGSQSGTIAIRFTSVTSGSGKPPSWPTRTAAR